MSAHKWNKVNIIREFAGLAKVHIEDEQHHSERLHKLNTFISKNTTTYQQIERNYNLATLVSDILSLNHIEGSKNPADVLTKRLSSTVLRNALEKSSLFSLS
ncbi:unnamed protein product [Ambrosiozyma monospora]|uniref:Unnamed protein product n=1 Tax=Ambrosiozyma monospora TaxID=43982 RepID=A0A9W6Z0F2_AMBMO|nr:unnamed protein product [Ambrosiozyma monospora]